jgi:peptide/nickel transport system substrate-binding protein
MSTDNRRLLLLSLGTILSLILSACGPGTIPTPERVVETVIVTQLVEGTPVEIVVTPTPDPEGSASGERVILPAEGLEACQPLPAGIQFEAQASTTSGHLASLVPSEDNRPAGPAPAPAFDTPRAAALQQDDTVYRVGVFEDITTLNFWAANGPDNTVWNSYMLPPRLTMYGLSEVYFNLIPSLAIPATPEPLVEEGEFWVTEIPIRQGVQWSDGTPLTANDVAFSANAPLQLGLISGNWSQWVDGNFLDRVEAVDDTTVKYYYHTRPGMARHEFGTLQAPILAEHYWAPIVEEALAPVMALSDGASDEELAAARAEAQDLLFAHAPEGEPTAGAYLLERWETGAFLDTVANEGYFLGGQQIEQFSNGAYRDSAGTVIGEPQGEPALRIQVGPFASAVVYTVYGSQDAAILALKNGEVDFVLNSLGLQRGLAAQVENDPNLTVIDNRANSFRYLSFNNRRRPMNDCSFRQAVAVLIDKEFVTSTILQNAAFPFYTYVAEGNAAWYFDDVPKLGRGLNREQRLQAAMAILEQAGYTWEGDQKPTYDPPNDAVIPGGRLVMPDGTPVPDLEMWAPNAGYDPLRSTFAIWIETWLTEVGIPVTAQLAGFNTLIPRIFTEQDFDMYILGWSLGIFPSGLRDFFSEEQAAPDGNNAGGYISEEFEQLSRELLLCPDEATCKPISDEIQRVLAVETPYVVLFDTGILEAFRSATVEYPFTEQLSGLQYTHQTGILQAEVNIK